MDWVLKGLEIEKNPVTIDTGVFKAYEGVYGPRKIWQEEGKFYYQREGRQKFELTPMGNDMFLLKDLDYFRIKFKRNKAGAVIEIIGMYDNGRTDSNRRN